MTNNSRHIVSSKIPVINSQDNSILILWPNCSLNFNNILYINHYDNHDQEHYNNDHENLNNQSPQIMIINSPEIEIGENFFATVYPITDPTNNNSHDSFSLSDDNLHERETNNNNFVKIVISQNFTLYIRVNNELVDHSKIDVIRPETNFSYVNENSSVYVIYREYREIIGNIEND
jgi:hypothetical protein